MWIDSKEELEMSRFYHPENRGQLGGSEQEYHMHGSFLGKDARGYCTEAGLDKNQTGEGSHTPGVEDSLLMWDKCEF